MSLSPSQPRKLPLRPSSRESSPMSSPRIGKRNSLRGSSSQIPVRKDSGTPTNKAKPAPLLRTRSRDFMDAVKKFEGGKLPEKLMKTVDEERKAMGDHLAQCENDLREIREFVARTQEDFQKIRSQTRKLKNEVNELRDFNKMALKRS